jgi:hypothetical protein
MRTAGVAFVLACLVSGLLTPVVRRFALKHKLFDDHVSSRKIHGRPVPVWVVSPSPRGLLLLSPRCCAPREHP